MERKRITLLRLGLVIIFLFISGTVFISLAEDVVNRELISTYDPTFGRWLTNQASFTGDYVFSLVTLLGNGLVITFGTGLLGLRLERSKRRQQLVFLFCTVGGSALLNFILKNIFLRPRPNYLPAYIESGFSFPSGHAMVSIAFYGAVAYLAFLILKKLRIKIIIALGCLALSLLIGFSRLYLGVHYLTDVLGGWAAGGLWLALCILGDYGLRVSGKVGFKRNPHVK